MKKQNPALKTWRFLLLRHRLQLRRIKPDDLVKSRHPVEKRGPGICERLRTLDSGFRRNDGKNAFSTFCETIKPDEIKKMQIGHATPGSSPG
jgi:hypothetical protein